MRFAIIALIFWLSAGSAQAQIQIPDVGDGWRPKVDSAIAVIKAHDPAAHKRLLENCKSIQFIIAGESTTQPPSVIAISVNDMRLNSINNIAAILVHESYHLYIANQGIKLDPNVEEYQAYSIEYEFLFKIPDLEDWLFENALNRMLYYKSKIK